MGAGDQLKAAFLSNSKLSAKLRERVRTALEAVERTRSIVETLADALQAPQLAALDGLESRIMDQATAGAKAPGPAFVAMDALQKEAAAKRAELLGLSKKADKADPAARFRRALGPALATVAKARTGTRGIANEAEAARLQAAVESLSKKLVALTGQVDSTHPATPLQCDAAELLRTAAGDLLREVRGAQGLDPQPGTQRAVSKAVVTGVSTIKAIGDRLNAPATDAQGRTALQDVQGRLEVFDEHFAADPTKDPQAARRNKGMRLAAVAAVTADRIARDVNDPYLTPRIGQALVAEYAPEMMQTLAQGDDDEDDAKAAVRLAQALVMDDPLTRLMTNRIKPEEAVQRIRDMASVAGEPPSVMLKLLRQQFEMRIGSLTGPEVGRGEKSADKGAKGNFELSELTGELSQSQFTGMVDTTETVNPFGSKIDDQPVWQGDGSGLAFKSTGQQVHHVKAGDTLKTLAQAYLGDEGRWKELVADNKVVLVGKAPHDLQTFGADQALPVGAKLNVPGQMSVLDQLAPYVAAWDTPEAPVAAAPLGPVPADTAPGPDPAKSPLKQITPEELKSGAAKLKSPRDPAYIQAPGLGQNHAPRTPLDNAPGDTPQQRAKAEADRVQGQINERQYAHLRMLARADEDDREAVLAKEGKPLEDALAEKIAARYNKPAASGEAPRVDAAKARKIAKAAVGWIAKVPLTVTFTADRLFSDPAKDAPTHGEQYKSDAELTRGRETLEKLIGREQQQPLADRNDKQKSLREVGTQGGSKTVVGWKDRGDNYMRWRRDKDDRESRQDTLGFDEQQIFGAANAAFAQAKGGADGSHGSNYYGDAHFLLKDSVRNRCAFIVRSAGGKKPPVQRKNLEMLLYDMLTTVEGNAQFLDAMVAVAAGGAVKVPSLNWEVHFYGGFDLRKDAAAVYLPSGLDADVKKRIARFAATHGIDCQDIGAKPDGWDAIPKQDPTQMPLPAL